jgi:hypothetical protein
LKKEHVVNIYFKCFRVMLQVFYIDIAKIDQDIVKVDRNVAHVTMTIHICFKCMLQMFHLYQTYVASIFMWMLHIHACYKCMFKVF